MRYQLSWCTPMMQKYFAPATSVSDKCHRLSLWPHLPSPHVKPLIKPACS